MTICNILLICDIDIYMIDGIFIDDLTFRFNFDVTMKPCHKYDGELSRKTKTLERLQKQTEALCHDYKIGGARSACLLRPSVFKHEINTIC